MNQQMQAVAAAATAKSKYTQTYWELVAQLTSAIMGISIKGSHGWKISSY